jgi:chorismate-pyruvate lyase
MSLSKSFPPDLPPAAPAVTSRSPNHITEAELYTGSVARLASLFYDDIGELGQFDPVAPDDLPDEYRTLLAHNDHMTVTLESFHNCLVDVRVLAEWQDGASYARNSLLARHRSNAILQFGIVRLWLGDLPAATREDITTHRRPLGRVLIEHNLLREVELITLWRITPGSELKRHMQLTTDDPIFGRSAQILVDERPTVQLLEIVALPK